jgi:hypothetical protein
MIQKFFVMFKAVSGGGEALISRLPKNPPINHEDMEDTEVLEGCSRQRPLTERATGLPFGGANTAGMQVSTSRQIGGRSPSIEPVRRCAVVWRAVEGGFHPPYGLVESKKPCS